MRERDKRTKKIWGILISSLIVVSGGLVLVSMLMQSGAKMPEPEKIKTDRDPQETYLDQSVLNGAPFSEANVYNKYDDNKLHYAYITVLPTIDDKTNEPVTMNDLNNVISPAVNPVVEVMFQHGDKSGPELDIYKSSVLRPNGTMRVRGFSARRHPQKSFKISLSGIADQFLGQEVLNFNKHFSDALRISNKFCLDAFETIPDMGSLDTYFVKLYIRDISTGEDDQGFIDYGLFTMVEQPNRAYLEKHNLDKNGALYKAIDFSFADFQTEIKSKNDPYYDKNEFETVLEIRENPDHDKLIDMITAVNDTSNDMNDIFKTYFNRENYLTWMATNIIFGNIDATANNFLLYSPVNAKTWYFLPWDYDKTLIYTKRSIDLYKDYPPTLYGLANFWGITLHNRFFKNPKNVEDLSKKIDELMELYLSVEKCEILTQGYEDVFYDSLFLTPDILHLKISADELLYYTENMYDIMQYYVDLYYKNLELPMPVYMSKPEQNGKEFLFEWDESYDYQNDGIFYTLQIARDLDFENILYSSGPLIDTEHIVTLDYAPDIYYYRVLIEDEKGNKQINLETYTDPVSGDEYMSLLGFEVK